MAIDFPITFPSISKMLTIYFCLGSPPIFITGLSVYDAPLGEYTFILSPARVIGAIIDAIRVLGGITILGVLFVPRWLPRVVITGSIAFPLVCADIKIVGLGFSTWYFCGPAISKIASEYMIFALAPEDRTTISPLKSTSQLAGVFSCFIFEDTLISPWMSTR